MTNKWIRPAEWKVIVKNVPIVSVDLVVLSPSGVVLGKRANEPAKGEWFVPGGRVQKNERLIAAVDRIAAEELGVESVAIQESLGCYEHIYPTADIDGVDSKHYLANGFVVETKASVDEMHLDDQHDEVRGFESSTLPRDLHEYTAAYLQECDSVPFPSHGN